jgi:hypothetical protein
MESHMLGEIKPQNAPQLMLHAPKLPQNSPVMYQLMQN